MADEMEGLMEWDELPADNSQAWFGLLLCCGSAAVSLKILAWVAVSVGRFIMQ